MVIDCPCITPRSWIGLRYSFQLIASTIEQTKDIPEALSEAGKIGVRSMVSLRMPHGEIMRQIGQLFLLRMNINLVGNVLDSPVRPGPNYMPLMNQLMGLPFCRHDLDSIMLHTSSFRLVTP
ncbi:DUF155 domain-containing protein [Rhizoctonia solani AG-1 IA]|uniref:DUF155 domain-containing protein n=1 Tax=Thanatephorus cucumeris (strain AG1-IA) TaxID=983506 RepID=L8X5M1_THACA|nr:DUF155 domain-containing protein [Rhizoctonia solani AG-1 IA]